AAIADGWNTQLHLLVIHHFVIDTEDKIAAQYSGAAQHQLAWSLQVVTVGELGRVDPPFFIVRIVDVSSQVVIDPGLIDLGHGVPGRSMVGKSKPECIYRTVDHTQLRTYTGTVCDDLIVQRITAAVEIFQKIGVE